MAQYEKASCAICGKECGKSRDPVKKRTEYSCAICGDFNVTDCLDMRDKEKHIDQIIGMVDIIRELGYIKNFTVLGDKYYRITAAGWKHIQELQRKNDVLAQAFVAMWFKDSMNEARESIENAISACGFTPVIIDVKEHNNQIVPKIFYEIKEVNL